MKFRILMLSVCIVLAAALRSAEAHDGHDLSQLTVTASLQSQTEQGVTIALSLQNLRDVPVTLQAAYCDLGPVTISQALPIAPGAALQAVLTLQAQAVPDLFTLVLDFGEAGYGPITIFDL